MKYYSSKKRDLGERLTKYEYLHSFSKKLYQIYSNFFGRFHSLPDFIIIGGGRCGTTSLYYFLSQHPSLYLPKNKGIRFFDRKFHKGLNWYRLFFPSLLKKFLVTKIFKKEFITGEATPLYIQFPHTPKRIRSTIPNVKLIAILRNPVNRAFSQYQSYARSKFEKLSFEEAIRDEEERIKDELDKITKNENYSKNFSYEKFAYKTRSRYAEQLEKWFEFFPKNQFLILSSEEYFFEPQKTAEKIMSFLEIKHFKFDSKITLGVTNTESSTMDPKIKQELIKYFEPHNKKLFNLIDLEFDWN